jgi:hypothetical protein
VWQALRNELHPKGFELVTVGLDTLGDAGCRAFIEAAKPQHPALLDQHHVLADLFGVINIPGSVWIDRRGMIVRLQKRLPPPGSRTAPRVRLPSELPQRFIEIMGERQDQSDAVYRALRDWVNNSSASRFALSPEEVIERSFDESVRARAFRAGDARMDGHHDGDSTLREAHRLVPEAGRSAARHGRWKGDRRTARALRQGRIQREPEAVTLRRLARRRPPRGAENYSEPWRPERFVTRVDVRVRNRDQLTNDIPDDDVPDRRRGTRGIRAQHDTGHVHDCTAPNR